MFQVLFEGEDGEQMHESFTLLSTMRLQQHLPQQTNPDPFHCSASEIAEQLFSIQGETSSSNPPHPDPSASSPLKTSQLYTPLASPAQARRATTARVAELQESGLTSLSACSTPVPSRRAGAVNKRRDGPSAIPSYLVGGKEDPWSAGGGPGVWGQAGNRVINGSVATGSDDLLL